MYCCYCFSNLFQELQILALHQMWFGRYGAAVRHVVTSGSIQFDNSDRKIVMVCVVYCVVVVLLLGLLPLLQLLCLYLLQVFSPFSGLLSSSCPIPPVPMLLILTVQHNL